MAEPVIAQKSPFAVEVEAGKVLLVVRLRALPAPALLRRQPPRDGEFTPVDYTAGRLQNSVLLWLQAFRQPSRPATATHARL